MRKRFYILFVTRDAEGQLRKIPIPLQYVYVFIAGAFIGMLTVTGMAGSYARMLMKVMRFNQVRAEKEQLKNRYSRLEKVAHEKDIQVASLGSLASEVSTLYGLKAEPAFTRTGVGAESQAEQVKSSIDQLYALRTAALSGAATLGIGMGSRLRRSLTAADWLQLAQAPTLWPVEGRVTGPYGRRIDPFNGEGSVHRGIDISTNYGHPVIAPADGLVTYANFYNGYGRMVEVDHGHGFTTRYGHLSAFAVMEGQNVRRGQIIGYVGLSGRSTGPHLHYEVWVGNAPVNPSIYLPATTFRASFTSAGAHD